MEQKVHEVNFNGEAEGPSESLPEQIELPFLGKDSTWGEEDDDTMV